MPTIPHPTSCLHQTPPDGLVSRGKRLLYPHIINRGVCVQSHVPLNHVYHTSYEGKNKKFFQYSPRRFSPLITNLENIKKPVSNHGRECISSALEHEYGSNLEADCSEKASLSQQLNAFYRFSRPHTVIGTIIGIASVSLLPIQSIFELTPTFFIGILKAMVPSILMNIYVVGLNQLYDVEIDKVNKPELPIASGEYSMGFGVAIVATFSALSFAMGFAFQSPPLLYALLISFLLGSAYSIDHPFLRWKRHAFLAATCILSVRALVVQLAFFLHIQKYVLGKPVVFTKALAFGTAFMCFFSAVIALFKDIPDVDGDQTFGIQSFSVQLGQKKVFELCIYMLLIAYGTGIVVGVSSPYTFSKIITVLGHSILASLLWIRVQYIDLTSKESITSFYMFIWKLFYAEYFLIPFVR